MELLRDLNKLAHEVVQNFNEKFDAGDCRIPQAFKDKVKRLKTFSIVYNDYSVVIKGDGVRSKDSYVPNQSFFMASFFIEYSFELAKYKQKIIPLITSTGITTNELTDFFTHERDYGIGDVQRGEDRFVKILDAKGYNEADRDYLIKFVTDYSWWSGSKTIERSDFFNSPVLSIMGLTASSNAAMALIVDYLTQNPDDSTLLLEQAKNIKQDNMHIGNNKIYYGAPGTGKSNKVKEQTAEAEKEGRVFRTTFHPDSDYSTFVGCYKPTMKLNVISKNGVETKEEQIVYRFVPQAFTNAYVKAWSTTEDVYLVIEEINRGNCAQIFGDLFQLLDRKDGVSEYPINADSDLRDHICKALETSERTDFPDGVKEGKKLVLPSNFYIWATMNTSDQSLFPIDSAFKRRWDWVYMPIDTKKESWFIKVGESRYSWTAFLEKVNNEILTDETAEDKHLGFYFCKAEGGEITQETFVGKVLFYLWNDVFKVYGIPSLKIGSNKDWPYRKFYNTDGTVNEQKVKELMEKLEIEKEPAS